MPEQQADGQPAVVTLPAEIDLTNAGRARDLLDAAFAAGAPVVIADFSGTAFCDCSAMRAVLAAGHLAAARGAQLRLAIPPGTAVRRLADLLGLDRQVPVYPGPAQAAAGPPAGTTPGPQIAGDGDITGARERDQDQAAAGPPAQHPAA
jgi:anti-anti-sigma factor